MDAVRHVSKRLAGLDLAEPQRQLTLVLRSEEMASGLTYYQHTEMMATLRVTMAEV